PGKILARPRGSFSQQFGKFFNGDAKSINKAYGRTGNLFGDRFKRKEVEGIDSLKVVVQYIHLNPQTHMFVKDFRFYPHSSYQSIARRESSFLLSDEVLSWFGGQEEFERYHLYNPDPRGLTGNFS
ncbi:MAG: transposase, partial [Bacteroidota bacterium]